MIPERNTVTETTEKFDSGNITQGKTFSLIHLILQEIIITSIKMIQR